MVAPPFEHADVDRFVDHGMGAIVPLLRIRANRTIERRRNHGRFRNSATDRMVFIRLLSSKLAEREKI
jgi:hypothetical protein